MSAPFRLASGGRIDRARPISFAFDGKTYQGFAGDTLASALHRQRRPSRRPLATNTIARAEFLAPARTSRTRSSASIEGAGRFTPNLRATQIPLTRRPRRDEPEPLAVAGIRRRRDQRSVLAAVFRGLLLQDLHGPEPVRQELGLETCLRAVRAANGGPRRGADASPTPTPTRNISTIAMR